MADASPMPARGASPGARLREARKERGVSLRELARLLAVSPATLSAIENGRRGMPAARLERAAELLGAPVETLVAGTAEAGRGPFASGAPSAPLPDHEVTETDWRRYEPLALDGPLAAALSAFMDVGYHGATVRDIARRANLSVPGVYHHYASKQQMLVTILDVTMADLLARSTAARAEGRDAVERFALLVECLALFHTHRRELGFLGASEMRSLVPPERERVAAARRQQQHIVEEEVQQACLEGSFAVLRPHEASRAVVTMCTALAQWFDATGSQSAEAVAAQYVQFALDLMRCTNSARRRAGRRRSAPPVSS